MNRQTREERSPAPPIKPRYGKLALLTLICLAVYHVLTCLGYRLLFCKLEAQMIIDGTMKELAWVLFAYAIITLAVLTIVTVVLYYRNEARMKAYVYETSVDRFGRRGARAARKRHTGFALREALLTAGLSALIWLPVAVLIMLAGIMTDVAWISWAADKLETLFMGVAGLFRPFAGSWLIWIGYFVGVLWVFVLRFLGGLLVHRKWDDEYAD
jgi:hypothetical protein